MKENEKEHLKNRVKERIEEVQADIKSYEALCKPVAPDNAIGRLTRLEAMNSKSINEEALRKAKQTLSKLEKALKFIDDPDYGYCEYCDEPIPVKRLMIMPETSLCVLCAEKMG